MHYSNGTFTPNVIYDQWISRLTHCELKVLLIIIRQTIGWKLKNGKRKQRDRISNSQFIKKAHVSERNISPTIQSLIDYNLIRVSDYNNEPLSTAQLRRGKRALYYQCLLSTSAHRHKKNSTYVQKELRKSPYNKRNSTKETTSKGGFHRINIETDFQRIQNLISENSHR